MDNELFELCKKVHEKTAWVPIGFNPAFYDERGTHPLYTSDYLLEKLPSNTYVYGIDLDFRVSWTAKRYGDEVHADTPLKALLKLVLALHEAKEL